MRRAVAAMVRSSLLLYTIKLTDKAVRRITLTGAIP